MNDVTGTLGRYVVNSRFAEIPQAVRHEAARALLYLAAAKVTANAPDKSRFSAMAKRLATDNGSAIVDAALAVNAPDRADPLECLRRVGGLDALRPPPVREPPVDGRHRGGEAGGDGLLGVEALRPQGEALGGGLALQPGLGDGAARTWHGRRSGCLDCSTVGKTGSA